MFKPVLAILSVFILGLSTGANAAFTSGSVKPVYSSCSAAGYRDSAGSYCGYSTQSIYTGTSGGACGTAKTCYSGGKSCSSSCTSGSASVGSGKCYTGTSSYTNCSSCASTTCYTGLQTVYSSCSAAGYRASSSGYCGYSSPKIYTGTSNGKCGTQTTCYSGGKSCSSSCSSGSASITSSQCYTGTSSYTNCSSCSSTTCYTGVKTAYSSCAAAGYLESCATGYTATNVTISTNPGGVCGTKTCKKCTKKLNTGCSSCCTSAKPYCYNNTCYATCPAGNNLQCPMCAVLDDRLPTVTTSCPGGARYSSCACGGTHTALGNTAAHMCTVN